MRSHSDARPIVAGRVDRHRRRHDPERLSVDHSRIAACRGHTAPRAGNQPGEFAEPDTIDISAYRADQIIPVEVKSGSVVFFNGHTLHSSRRNKTVDSFRMALVNHYMSAESMLPWDQDGKLPLTEDLRDIVMVAGQDPYAGERSSKSTNPICGPMHHERTERTSQDE